MARAAVGWLVPVAFCWLALLGSPRVLLAQAAGEAERVKIPTIDGVELRGFFYPSAKKNAPTVLVLHALGQHSQVTGWKDLAQALQPSYSVMLFDFRGHGESKTVDPTLFWKYEPNRLASLSKVTYGKDMIDYKNFDKTGAYYPMLINDIAAVKGYLDRRSDQNGCNTSSFILIGAESGATLGAIWLNSEWSRYKVSLGAGGFQLDNRPEGKDTIAAIWVSIKHDLGTKRKIKLSDVLDEPAKKGATPMVFMYGESNTVDASTAKGVELAIKGKKAAANLKYTGSFPLGKTNLAGVSLLAQKSLKVDAKILEYLDNVVSNKGNEWADHDYRKSQYVWKQSPVSNAVVAKQPGEMNPVFDTYEKFMR